MEFTPELIGAVVALLQVEQGIEMYKKYKDIIEECVERAMEKAEALTAMMKLKKNYEQNVFDRACNIPKYVPCANARLYARLGALRRADDARNQRSRVLDRGQVGLRVDADRQATLGAMVASVNKGLDADRAERLLYDNTVKFCINAISAATMIGQYPTAVGAAYRSAGDGLVSLQGMGASIAQGGLTAFGATTGSVYKKIQQNRENERTATDAESYGEAYSQQVSDRHPPATSTLLVRDGVDVTTDYAGVN